MYNVANDNDTGTVRFAVNGNVLEAITDAVVKKVAPNANRDLSHISLSVVPTVALTIGKQANVILGEQGIKLSEASKEIPTTSMTAFNLAKYYDDHGLHGLS